MGQEMSAGPSQHMPKLAILLLAAGASSRMRGRDKLLEQVNGRPLVAGLSDAARASGCEVYVTVPHLEHPRASAAGEAHLVAVPNAVEGLSASLRAGITALAGDIDGVMVLPADMPEITTVDFLKMAEQFTGPEGAILRASGTDQSGARRVGHPVLFPRRCFDALQTLTGDAGARELLKQEAVQLIALPGAHALTDLDTPEDWTKWRTRQGDV